MSRKDTLKDALELAAQGMFVVALYNTDEAGVCSCPAGAACKSPGKHPLTTNGLLDATTNAAQIRAWWLTWPDANIGIATEPSGLVAIDVDGKDRRPGPEEWGRLVEELGPELEQTTIVDTASGSGSHVYYRAAGHRVKSVNDALGAGIDVKAVGGYVVAPPSVIAGREYAFREGHGLDRLADLPPALAERLSLAREAQPDRVARPVPRPDDQSLFFEGERNPTLASLAGGMRRRGESEQEITQALLEINARRCVPPLGEKEVRDIAKSISRYPPAAAIAASGDRGEDIGAGDQPRRLHPVSMAELAQREPEDVPAVVPFYAFEQCITDLAAQPKTGKSTFLVSCARAVCRGERFLGGETKRGPVVYLTEESLPTFLSAARRVGADEERDLYPIFRREAFGMGWSEVCAEVRACCEELGAVLVIVDTLSDWANIRGDDENSAGRALEALEPLRSLAELPGLAVIVARHERKSGGEVGEAARGSSQFVGGVDVVVSMRRTKGEVTTRRTLQALSRLDATPAVLVVEFTGGGFQALGAAAGLQRADKEGRVLALLRPGREQAIGAPDVAFELGDISEATARRVLDRLVDEALACKAKGAAPGRHATAYGYWRLVPHGPK